MADQVKCPKCGQMVYRDERGRVLIHTTGAYDVAKVCEGWDRGAKPDSSTSTRRR